MTSFLENIRQLAIQRRLSRGSGCSHLKVSPVMEQLDLHGDMIIYVGNQARTVTPFGEQSDACFRVNSTVVAGASPAFGLVLLSPSAAAEGRNDGDKEVKWSVSLPDDDPQAMRIVINILYGHYPPLPLDGPMSLEHLLSLTILADKYDLVHLFAEWSAQWISDMEPYWVNQQFVGQSTENLELLLWISWVLGHEPLYAYAVLQIAFHTELDAAGKLTDPDGQLCFTNELRKVPVPPFATIEISHVRLEVLKMMRKDIKETLEEHLHGRPVAGGQPRCARSDGVDDRIWRRNVRDSFVSMLITEGIWLLPSAYVITASARSLVEMFRANPNIPSFIHRHGDRLNCDPHGTFWEHLERFLNDVCFALPRESVAHLTKQAAKSGLAKYFKSRGGGADRHCPVKAWSIGEVLMFRKAIIVKSEPVPH